MIPCATALIAVNGSRLKLSISIRLVRTDDNQGALIALKLPFVRTANRVSNTIALMIERGQNFLIGLMHAKNIQHQISGNLGQSLIR